MWIHQNFLKLVVLRKHLLNGWRKDFLANFIFFSHGRRSEFLRKHIAFLSQVCFSDVMLGCPSTKLG